jgi:hypothetical protein
VNFQPWDRDNSKLYYIWIFVASALSGGLLAAPIEALLLGSAWGPGAERIHVWLRGAPTPAQLAVPFNMPSAAVAAIASSEGSSAGGAGGGKAAGGSDAGDAAGPSARRPSNVTGAELTNEMLSARGLVAPMTPRMPRTPSLSARS